MFKSLLTGACLMAVLAGCASTSQNPTSAAAANSGPKARCLSTASRIPTDKNECAAFGRSYSGDQLQQTGHVDIGQALQTLDPSIAASGGH
jgi:hypothetical protein